MRSAWPTVAVVSVCALGACGGEGAAASGSGLIVSVTSDGSSARLTVFVEDRRSNTLTTTDGSRTVFLECVGRDGSTVLRTRQRWPFTDTDGGTALPHVHEPLDQRSGRIVECRLDGTAGPLAGAPDLAR